MQTTEIFSSQLPVGETLSIKRTRFEPLKKRKNLKRISIISGIHGDELEGQYAIYLLSSWLNENSQAINGIIDLYPAVNSLGVDSIVRGFPLYEVDLNRVFPGGKHEFFPGQIANAFSLDVKGSDIAIDIHSSNIFLREIPQVRISREFSKDTLPLAKKLNCDFIWMHDAVTVLEATLSHTLNQMGTKTLVVEMGVGMRVTKHYGEQLLNGMLNLMKEEGILITEQVFESREAFSSEVGQVFYINSSKAGLFVPEIDHCAVVEEGDKIGTIVNPLDGKILDTIYAPSGGILFTLRAYPVTYEGSLIARIFGSNNGKN